MKNDNSEEIQNKLEIKALKRRKKKKSNMKVSGGSVKKLQKIIIEKSK